MNEDSVQKKAKYLNMGKCIKKTFIIFLVVLLVLIMLPIGAFVSYVAFIRCGNTVLFTYETEKGHTVTVTQSGRHEQLTNTYLIFLFDFFKQVIHRDAFSSIRDSYLWCLS